MDQISRFRVARLSLFPPMTGGDVARYAAITTVIKKGIPTSQILCDGTLRGVHPFPTHEEVLEAFDAAIRQHMIG